mmetsp:Transcript_5286/g.14492  ORF Transcript_5286/g.14492 Transcript_5286/m.14492 type:complete len:371 (-) Transcript_5286:51-1163(-)
MEGGGIRFHDLLEVGKVSLAHRLHDVEVGAQGALELRLLEGDARGHLAHEQLHHSGELGHSQAEACGRALGRLALCLEKAAMRLRVLELHRLDATQVVQVPRELVVGRVLGEARLGHHLVSLIVELVCKVVAKQQVEEHHLAQRVVVERGRAVRGEELRPNLGRAPRELVGAREGEPQLGAYPVQRALVHLLYAAHRGRGEAHCAIVVLVVDEELREQQRKVGLRLRAYRRALLRRRGRSRVNLHAPICCRRLSALGHRRDELQHHGLERMALRDVGRDAGGDGFRRELAADCSGLAQHTVLRLGVLCRRRTLDESNLRAHICEEVVVVLCGGGGRGGGRGRLVTLLGGIRLGRVSLLLTHGAVSLGTPG